MDDTNWEQMMPGPKAPGGPIGPLTSHQFALSTVAAPAVVWTALTDGDLTCRYLYGLTAHSTWSRGAPLTLRSGGGSAGPPAAGRLTGQVLRAEPFRQLSYLLQSGPDDPPTFLTWQLRATPGGTTLRLQIDELEGSSDDDEPRTRGCRSWPPSTPCSTRPLPWPSPPPESSRDQRARHPSSDRPTTAGVSTAIRTGQPRASRTRWYVRRIRPEPGVFTSN